MKSELFPLHEWFSKRMIEVLTSRFGRTRGEERLWGLLDGRIILVAESLRKRFGKCYINNWAYGGEFHQCGFRGNDTTTGAIYSGHKFGRCSDMHFTQKVSYDEIRADIKKNPIEFITEIELDTHGWLHTSVRNTNQEGILWLPNVSNNSGF